MATTKVNCPQCQSEVLWDKSALYRPFCSERCKLLDLGAWAKEEHVIPGKSQTGEHSIVLPEDEFNLSS